VDSGIFELTTCNTDLGVIFEKAWALAALHGRVEATSDAETLDMLVNRLVEAGDDLKDAVQEYIDGLPIELVDGGEEA